MFEAGVEVFHITGGEILVVQGEGEFKFGIDGGEEIIFAVIGEAFHSIGEDMTEVGGFRRVPDAEAFLTTREGMIGVVIDASGRLGEEVVAFNDVADGGGGDCFDALFFAEGV